MGKFGVSPSSGVAANYGFCKMTRKDQVAASVFINYGEKVIMTYTRGDSKIRVHREDPEKEIEIYCRESGT